MHLGEHDVVGLVRLSLDSLDVAGLVFSHFFKEDDPEYDQWLERMLGTSEFQQDKSTCTSLSLWFTSTFKGEIKMFLEPK